MLKRLLTVAALVVALSSPVLADGPGNGDPGRSVTIAKPSRLLLTRFIVWRFFIARVF
jgi:hypothetical protein